VNSRPWRRFGVVAATAAALVVALSGVTSPAYAASSSTSCTDMTLDEVQSRVLADVNKARTKAGASKLKEYSALNTVAVNWSKRQAAAEEMSHNPNYAKQIPPGWSAAGENVAYGYSPTAVTGAWMDSPGHRANILRTSFTHIGIGVACSESGSPYYTQVFGGYAAVKAATTKALKTVTPKVSGTPTVGKKLTAIRGTWTAGTAYSYKWYASGKLISGATGKTYTPTSSTAGKVIKVKVTGKKSGYTTATKTSAATAKVKKK
jgi:uncharacterized protein YkwD